MIISLDTECTGLDLASGAMPFLVTTCSDDDVIRYWEWDVNPLTRRPAGISPGDIDDIRQLMDDAELIYLQNAKFDARALLTIGLELPWDKVRDTLVMGHLLESNHPHDLTRMCIDYLGVDIEPYEVTIRMVTQECRAIVRRLYPSWRIAQEGAEGMPSVTGSSKRDEDRPWKNDMWLPRALAKRMPDGSMREGLRSAPESWLTACSRYANADSDHTLHLGLEMERLIHQRGLWSIYEHRLHLPRVACEMEQYGVTVIGSYTRATIQSYERYVAEAADVLTAIAAGYGHDLRLAEGAALNDNMREFFYGSVKGRCLRCGHVKTFKHWNGERPDSSICSKCAKGTKRRAGATCYLDIEKKPNLGLRVIKGKKTGNASLDKSVMQDYITSLDGEPLEFIRILTSKRKRDTDLTYMQAYCRFWLPVRGSLGYYRIHPSLNPCGTDHLRWSSSNPNLQNVGKQEDTCDECDGNGCDYCEGTGRTRVSVRSCFGPAPGREWWSMDFQNIELRIPAYESGEKSMIELFERASEPPYFGSYHCLNASIVYPDLFWPLAESEGEFKKLYKSTEYQWCKNGGFALQYGCGEAKADATFRRRGAYRMLREKLPKITELNQHYIDMAERSGYVETLPDRSVDPERGYPILASRTEDGRVLSTTPFNYHVSGTACWCKNTALVRCSDQCVEWRRGGFDAHIALEVHDEIIFDFPRGTSMEDNLPRAMMLKSLMEQSGEDLVPRIPTPVSVEYHSESWASGVVV